MAPVITILLGKKSRSSHLCRSRSGETARGATRRPQRNAEEDEDELNGYPAAAAMRGVLSAEPPGSWLAGGEHMAVDSTLLSPLKADPRGSRRARCFLGLQSPHSELPLDQTLQYSVVRFVSSESPFDDARSLYRLLQLSALQHSVGCTQPLRKPVLQRAQSSVILFLLISRTFQGNNPVGISEQLRSCRTVASFHCTQTART